MKKLHVKTKGPIGEVLRAFARTPRTQYEIVESVDEASEVMSTDPNEAVDLLFAGKNVVLVSIGRKDTASTEALRQNEAFMGRLSIFSINFTENDSMEVGKLINHFRGETP